MPSIPKKRLDIHLVERGLFPTRAKAGAAILAGQVYVDGRLVDKAGTGVPEGADIRVARLGGEYASRGGKKLEAALEYFMVDMAGKVALDVGASTGGFTDCLLQAGARRVFALDVGYGLLDERLRRDERVKVLERVNIRYATPDLFDEIPDLAAVDVAFISLKLVLPALNELGVREMLTLVKPQFEAGREFVKKGGVIRDPKIHQRTISGVAETARNLDYKVKGPFESPLKGPKGNKEFFLYMQKAPN